MDIFAYVMFLQEYQGEMFNLAVRPVAEVKRWQPSSIICAKVLT